MEFAQSVTDPDAEAFLTAIEERLTKFREHKDVLLSHLQDGYERGPKAKPFNTDESWSQIERLAFIQYSQQRVKEQAMGAAERKARHREIAEVLTRARSMIENAMQWPDLANDLIDSWWQGTNECAQAEGRFVDLLYIQREFEKVIKELAALQEAAVRAATGIQGGPGRPKGSSVLLPTYIYTLAILYRDCTGSKPGAGHGPFSRFVNAYLAAIGLGRIEDESVVDIIKDARVHAQNNPRKWQPSPFED